MSSFSLNRGLKTPSLQTEAKPNRTEQSLNAAAAACCMHEQEENTSIEPAAIEIVSNIHRQGLINAEWNL